MLLFSGFHCMKASLYVKVKRKLGEMGQIGPCTHDKVHASTVNTVA